MASTDITVKLNIDSEQFERDLARLTKKIGRVSDVPAWCYVPWMRWFVQVSAMAAPMILLVNALR